MTSGREEDGCVGNRSLDRGGVFFLDSVRLDFLLTNLDLTLPLHGPGGRPLSPLPHTTTLLPPHPPVDHRLSPPTCYHSHPAFLSPSQLPSPSVHHHNHLFLHHHTLLAPVITILPFLPPSPPPPPRPSIAIIAAVSSPLESKQLKKNRPPQSSPCGCHPAHRTHLRCWLLSYPASHGLASPASPTPVGRGWARRCGLRVEVQEGVAWSKKV